MFVEGRDSLLPKLEQSADFMNKEVMNNSSYITGKTKGEWEKIINTLTDDQLARNRKIVKEIVETCEYFKAEIAEEVLSMRGDQTDDG
jgi:hypothetical protein